MESVVATGGTGDKCLVKARTARGSRGKSRPARLLRYARMTRPRGDLLVVILVFVFGVVPAFLFLHHGFPRQGGRALEGPEDKGEVAN
jgi:hypothetical protein